MIKRVLAYIFDIFAISIIVGALAVSPMNPNSDAMTEMQNEYVEKIKEFEVYDEDSDSDKAASIDVDGFIEYYKDYMYEYNRLSVYEEVITLVCIILYYVVFAYFFDGQTVGKRIMRIKVVKKDSTRADIASLIIRAVILFRIPFSVLAQVLVFFINQESFVRLYAFLNVITFALNVAIIAMIIVREDKRGLHDILAKTKVIESEVV